MTIAYRDSLRDTRLDAVDTAAGATATVRVYDNTGGVPADPDTAISTQVLLAELSMTNPAFGAASGGTLTANAISDDTSANATGSPAFFRIHDGTNDQIQGSAGVGSGDLDFNASITGGANVSISSLVITDGSATSA